MSYIRLSDTRDWTEGEPLYVYPAGDRVYAMVPGWGVPNEDWVEVTMRMLDQSGRFDDETLWDIYTALAERTYLFEDDEE